VNLLGERNGPPNIPRKGSIIIGDGEDGEERIGFALKDDKFDIGFIKVFWSTTDIDLSDVEQSSPGSGGPETAPRKPFLYKQSLSAGEWGALTLSVTQIPRRRCV
jgi:hypothetical protein